MSRILCSIDKQTSFCWPSPSRKSVALPPHNFKVGEGNFHILFTNGHHRINYSVPPQFHWPVPSLSLAEEISESYNWEKPTLQPTLELQNNLAKLNLNGPSITQIFDNCLFKKCVPKGQCLEIYFSLDTILAGPVALVEEVIVLNWSRVNLD